MESHESSNSSSEKDVELPIKQSKTNVKKEYRGEQKFSNKVFPALKVQQTQKEIMKMPRFHDDRPYGSVRNMNQSNFKFDQ